VLVGGGLAAAGLALKLAVGGVGIAGAAIAEQAILRVVSCGDRDTRAGQAIAVDVVGVVADRDRLLDDIRQAPGWIVAKGGGVGDAAECLHRLGDAPEGIARVLRAIDGRSGVAGAVAGGFAEAVVAPCIGRAAKRRAGQQAVLGVVTQRQRTGLCKQA